MKIIKKGKRRIVSRRKTCPNCECEFEYEKRDVRYEQQDDHPWLFCPHCGLALQVPSWKDYDL